MARAKRSGRRGSASHPLRTEGGLSGTPDFCPNCSQAVTQLDRFCPACGTILPGGEEE